MEYKISDSAKKVTLGIALIGLVFLIIGFFQQKDFVYATKINDHTIEVKYNGKAGVEEQEELKLTMQSKMHGYNLEFHDNDHHDSNNGHQLSDAEAHSAMIEDAHDEHAHHGPTFLWNVHLSHVADASAHPEGSHQSGADNLTEMIDSGQIAFF
jgi:hypothetical protein